MRMKKSKGFALVELLLASIVFGVIITMVVGMQAEQQRDVGAMQVASKAEGVAAAARAYYEANSTAMLAAMADGTGASSHCMVKANPMDGTGGTVTNDVALHTCALDVAWLQWKKALPMGFDAKSGRGSRWVAVFKSIYSGTTQTGDVEMLLVMARDGATFDAPLAGAQLSKGANTSGSGGGYIPASDMSVCTAKRATTTYQACGAGGAWKVDLSNFISGAQLTTFGAALPN